MAIHKLSRYFDRLGNKLILQSDDIFDKSIDKSINKWLSEKRIELSDLKENLDKFSAFIIVKNIDERNDLMNTQKPGILVWVEDATGDKTVNFGGAAYLLRQVDNRLVWEKMTESEGLDVTTNMESISGKPKKLEEIDDTVEKAHEHINYEILQGVKTESGGLAYNDIKLLGQTGIDDRVEIEIVGDFTSKMKIVQEVILPDINSLSLYLYNYKPLR